MQQKLLNDALRMHVVMSFFRLKIKQGLLFPHFIENPHNVKADQHFPRYLVSNKTHFISESCHTKMKYTTNLGNNISRWHPEPMLASAHGDTKTTCASQTKIEETLEEKFPFHIQRIARCILYSGHFNLKLPNSGSFLGAAALCACI